jgi:hypothetical protein
MRVRGDLERHPILGRQRRLRDQQRRHRGIGNTLRHSITDFGSPSRQGADQVSHRIVFTQLYQAGDGVQLIRELMRLRPQRVRHALVRRQLSLQRRELGAVAHRRDRADPLALTRRRPPVQRQHPFPRDDHDVPAVLTRLQEVDHRGIQSDAGHRSSHRLVGHPEQILCTVVQQGDVTFVVHRDDALANTVQQRFPMIGQAGDLGDLQPTGVSFDPARQQP